jgi:predicted RNA-binding protein with PUA-like domain
MNYWLMKSELHVWSIDQLKKIEIKKAPSNEVRNYRTVKNLKFIKF